MKMRRRGRRRTRGMDEKGGSIKYERSHEKPMQIPSSSGSALREPFETLAHVPRRNEVIARACKGGCGANQPISYSSISTRSLLSRTPDLMVQVYR
jgi:hypothetical protein